MKAWFLFGLILSAVTGCTSSYDVANEPVPIQHWPRTPDKYSFAQVNEDAKDQFFTISTVHGEEIDATDLFIRGDSTSFLEPSVASGSTIATSSVETITIKKAWVGGLEGFGFGFIPGAVLGGVAGDHSSGEVEFAWYEGAVVVGTVTGVIGGIIGLIVGHTYEYQFVNKADSSKK